MKRIGNLFNRIISYENLVRLQKALKDYRQKLLSDDGIKKSTG